MTDLQASDVLIQSPAVRGLVALGLHRSITNAVFVTVATTHNVQLYDAAADNDCTARRTLDLAIDIAGPDLAAKAADLLSRRPTDIVAQLRLLEQVKP